jgi:catalase (peroxidase I)
MRRFHQRTGQNYHRFSPYVKLGLFGFLFGGGAQNYDKVRDQIREQLDDYGWDDGSWGPVLVRLAWHASGTYSKHDSSGGSNGATMRFAPEAQDGANAGLDYARKRLDVVKAKNPDLSYADLWVLASYVAIEEMGGPKIPFKAGRKDKPDGKSCPPVGRLPDASKGAQHVRDVFYRMGFQDKEIVALVGGGHALGRCHKNRSGYEGPWTRSPTTVSNEFFKMLFDEKWVKKNWNGPEQFENESDRKLMMLPTDLVMKTDPKFREWSEKYYKDNDLFLKDFAAAYKKLTELGLN